MIRQAMFAALAITFAGQAVAARRVPDASPAGDPVNCVPIAQIDHTRVRDDRTIDFVMRGGRDRVYRNVLPQTCPELGFEESFSYETSLSQLCNVDIITVLVRTGGLRRGASCGLGQFQPVSLVSGAHGN